MHLHKRTSCLHLAIYVVTVLVSNVVQLPTISFFFLFCRLLLSGAGTGQWNRTILVKAARFLWIRYRFCLGNNNKNFGNERKKKATFGVPLTANDSRGLRLIIVPLGYQLLFIQLDIKDMENISNGTRGVKVCSGEHDGSPGSCRRQERWPPPGGAGVGAT